MLRSVPLCFHIVLASFCLLTALFQLASNFFCEFFGSSADRSLRTTSGSYTDILGGLVVDVFLLSRRASSRRSQEGNEIMY